jgi:hypothetical protein
MSSTSCLDIVEDRALPVVAAAAGFKNQLPDDITVAQSDGTLAST